MSFINARVLGLHIRGKALIRCAVAGVFFAILSACGGGGAAPTINSNDVQNVDETSQIIRSACNIYSPFASSHSFNTGASQIGSNLIWHRPTYSFLRNGATLAIDYKHSTGNTVHDHLKWFNIYQLRAAVRPGDVLKIIDPKSSPDFNAGDEYTVLADSTTVRVNAYARAPEGHKNENRYLGVLVGPAQGCELSNVEQGKFIVPVRGAEDADLFVSEGGFLLRDNIHDFINEEFVMRRGGFIFAADADLQKLHFAREFTPLQFGDFSLRGNGGYKQLHGGETSYFYRRVRAMWSPSSGVEWYAQIADGAVRSEVYRDARLRGFAAGVFYKQLFRHNDSYHAKIERPLADESLALYRVAVAATFGDENKYIRINFVRNLHNDKTAARLFYHLRF